MRYRAGTAHGRWCTERTAWGQAWLRTLGVACVIAVAALGAVLPACGGSASDEGGNRSRGETTAGSRAGGGNVSAPSAASAANPKPTCPATGAWQICSVIERLDRAGLAPRRQTGEVREAPLSTPGVGILLGRSELRLFVYADRAARERDQAKLDVSKYITANEPVSMQAEPTLIASENLLAILRSRSDHQRERVSDALTAGPPQKPGPQS
jgi:hypothetical protein